MKWTRRGTAPRDGASTSTLQPGPVNPFLGAPATAVLEVEEPEAEVVAPGLEERHLVGAEGSVRGPLDPPGPLKFGPLRHWRLVEDASPPSHQVVGLHRAAGASTLADVLGGVSERWTCPADHTSSAAEMRWAVVDHSTVLVMPEGRPSMIAVAQLSPRGLRAALDAALEWGSTAEVSDRARLVGLVLVSDGRPTTRVTLRDARRVMRMYPRSWHLPWVPEWYMQGFATGEPYPRRHRRVASEINRWSDRLDHFSQEES